MAFGHFQEDVVEVVGHLFAGGFLHQGVPVEEPVGVIMQRESHDADEVDGQESIGVRSHLELPLDSECGVEDGPVVEEVLLALLHFHHESPSVGVAAFHIHPDVPSVGVLVGAFLRGVID